MDGAERNRTISYVGLGLGAAALVAGGVLFVTGSGGEKAETGLELRPHLGPGLASAGLFGRF